MMIPSLQFKQRISKTLCGHVNYPASAAHVNWIMCWGFAK